jgi:hypothetical protein
MTTFISGAECHTDPGAWCEVRNLVVRDLLLEKAVSDLKIFAEEVREGKPTSLSESDLRLIDFYLKRVAQTLCGVTGR